MSESTFDKTKEERIRETKKVIESDPNVKAIIDKNPEYMETIKQYTFDELTQRL